MAVEQEGRVSVVVHLAADRRARRHEGAPPVESESAPSAASAELLAPWRAAAAISTSGLSKDYGQGHGLFDLDLEIERGEIFGFLGPNGAGKSTTMRLLLDLIYPTAGSAQLLGLDTHRQSLEIRRRVGYLPGDFALYPKLTGAAMLDYLAELRGGVDGKVRDRAGRALRRPARPARA